MKLFETKSTATPTTKYDIMRARSVELKKQLNYIEKESKKAYETADKLQDESFRELPLSRTRSDGITPLQAWEQGGEIRKYGNAHPGSVITFQLPYHTWHKAFLVTKKHEREANDLVNYFTPIHAPWEKMNSEYHNLRSKLKGAVVLHKPRGFEVSQDIPAQKRELMVAFKRTLNVAWQLKKRLAFNDPNLQNHGRKDPARETELPEFLTFLRFANARDRSGVIHMIKTRSHRMLNADWCDQRDPGESDDSVQLLHFYCKKMQTIVKQYKHIEKIEKQRKINLGISR